MLKIKTLNPKRSKMTGYISKHGITQATVARCVGMQPNYFSVKLRNNGFSSQDEAVIKTVVDKLSAKRK